MIVATPKPVTELKNLMAQHTKVLFVGCGTCVTVCLAGGEREVGIAGYAMRMARKIEMEHILEAFEKGIDGVLVAGCLEGGCHFLEGNLRARKRTDRIREILDQIGVGGARLKMVNLSAAMAPTFVQRVHEIVDTVRALGPNPLKESVGRA